MMNAVVTSVCLAVMFSCQSATCENTVHHDLGCWRDTAVRAVPSIEDQLGGGDYTRRSNAIEKCKNAAILLGNDIFAVQNGGWCATSADARSTYKKYGSSEDCRSHGKGGPWANQVYEIQRESKEFCVVKFRDGKAISEGNCENSRRSPVLLDLDTKLEERKLGKRDNCDVTVDGLCYWTYFKITGKFSLSQAEQICAARASSAAYFSSEKTYNKVVENMRSQIPVGSLTVQAWIGLRLNTNTGEMFKPPKGGYVKWYHDYPLTGKDYTNVYLNVHRDPNSKYQGMTNGNPKWWIGGVVCRKKI